MRLAITHEAVFRHDATVRHSTQHLRLTPHSSLLGQVVDWELELPVPAYKSIDPYGNVLHVMTLDYPHKEIRVIAHGIVETTVEHESLADKLPPPFFLHQTELTKPDQAIRQFAEPHRLAVMTPHQLMMLMAALRERLVWTDTNQEHLASAAQTFSAGVGSSSHLTQVFLACARYLGVPARYVSGYIYSPGLPNQQVSLHAWAETWCDGRWHTFDVANQVSNLPHHLKLAIGLDFLDACPIHDVSVPEPDAELDTDDWGWMDEIS
ncbi:transglutaminase-like putative cysteine protease [Chitinivorax tropicus]|uniref:Transglutaminase-like putative cysteine protease n=1 Tax=Chitinivorax tropicus TaxID=714531 RepID=A0A840MSK7_9PROT|nr:transglutaminase family protein [Chitinivorax tropicus]MBB5019263.1 transglutaminase-like putative cysteine protease [Chitinivorax tropicus]